MAARFQPSACLEFGKSVEAEDCAAEVQEIPGTCVKAAGAGGEASARDNRWCTLEVENLPISCSERDAPPVCRRWINGDETLL